MAEKKKQEKQKENEKDYINPAIQLGIKSLIDEHPRFANFQEYLLKHIDQEKIQEKAYRLREEIKEKKFIDKKSAVNYFQNELASYIASGSVLDEKGKKVILKNSLEEKTGFFHKLFHKSKFNGEKYLDSTMEAFQDLHALFQSGDYAKRMPELKESFETLQDMQFADPAIDVLKSHGLIDDKKYNFLKENIYKKAGESSYNIVSGIEKRIIPESYQKVAASILLAFGTFLLISNMKITGAVIGSLNHSLKGIFGLSLMVFSAALFLSLNKKT